MNTVYTFFENQEYAWAQFPVLLGIFTELHLVYIFMNSIGSKNSIFYEEMELNRPTI
jgi:hypothetical protein